MSLESDEKLRVLVRTLEKSIEQAISRSSQVEDCLKDISKQGYEISLVLQATLAFAPMDELDQKRVDDLAGVGSDSEATFQMNSLDKKFLRSLKIAVDEESAG